MKNLISYFLMLCALMGVTASCTDALENMDETVTATKGFTIYATTEDAQNQTRLGLADDGMTMLWEYGDKLVLVNKESGDSIQMPANLVFGAVPTSSCSFTTEEGVPTGDYWVLCNMASNTLACSNYASETRENVNANKRLKLYASLHVNEGETSANIQLKNVYAKIRINLVNSSFTTATVGMLPAHGVVTSAKLIPETGLTSQSGSFEQVVLSGATGSSDSYALVLPQDFRGQNVYFYIKYGNSIYEIVKSGIQLEAGKSYAINLDLSTAIHRQDMSTLTTLSNASDFRFARYLATSKTYTLEQDVDLEGEVVFPLKSSLDGKGHTLRNVKIESQYADNVAISEDKIVRNLTIENATIRGRNYVSAFMARVSLGSNSERSFDLNCHLRGNSTVIGMEYVGGVIGYCRNGSLSPFLSNSSVDGITTISGESYVGGIVGRLSDTSMSHFKVGRNTAINANSYVGGICGEGSGNFTISNSYNLGNVSAIDYVGGVIGCVGRFGTTTLIVDHCYNSGNLGGEESVGGIIGESCSALFRKMEIKLSYNSGNITVTPTGVNVGGICGATLGAIIANCYSVGSIKGGSTNIGGIIGEKKISSISSSISNCYSSSPDISDAFNGVVGAGSISATNCITSLPNLGFTSKEEANNMAGVENLYSMISVINGDGVFSVLNENSIWPIVNYPSHCPVFIWQTDPLTGEVVTTPGFSTETEW